MIKLEEHKTYIESHKMDMVPYSVAKQAVEESIESSQIKQLDKAISALSEELTSLKPDLSKLK